MIFDQPAKSHHPFADQAAASANGALQATRRATDGALNSLSDSVCDMHGKVTPMLDQASKKMSALAQRGMDAVRDGSMQMRDKARHAGDAATGYIKDDPVKAMLIAAVTGAAVMGLIGLLTRSRS